MAMQLDIDDAIVKTMFNALGEDTYGEPCIASLSDMYKPSDYNFPNGFNGTGAYCVVIWSGQKGRSLRAYARDGYDAVPLFGSSYASIASNAAYALEVGMHLCLGVHEIDVPDEAVCKFMMQCDLLGVHRDDPNETCCRV